MKKVDERLLKASFDVKIETPSKGVLVNVEDVSYDDAWDHCQIILKENPDDDLLQEQLSSCLSSFGTQGFSGAGGYSIHISAKGRFIKDPTGEYHTCGRRSENSMDDESSPFRGAGKNLDTWDLRGDDLCCSYCGSIKPSRVLELVKEHGAGIIETTDKSYKWYLRRDEIINAGFGGIKYYRQHDTQKFIDELNKLIGNVKS